MEERQPAGAEEATIPGRVRRYARRLPARKAADVIRYFDVGQIDWIEAASQYARLHVGREAHLIRESMARLASWLDPEQFLRVHRSAIVNLDRIRELRTDSPSHRWAVLHDGTRLAVSPQSWEALKAALLGFR
jgi:two-component system LytT family response regulator